MQILIVEDDDLSRVMFQNATRKWGYEPVCMNNGLAAWEFLKTGQAPRLILLDWLMPGIDGLELCRRIKQELQDSPYYILLLTAKNMQDDIVHAFKAGIDDFIPKPVNLKELQSRIAVGARILEYQSRLAEHNAELEALNAQKNRFLGMAAHDLRNPLISIKGFSDLLLKKRIPAGQIDELLGIIHHLSQEMLSLIDDLLTISRIESSQFDIRLEVHDLVKLVYQRIKYSELQAANKQMTIVRPAPFVLNCVYDEARISQVMDNLLSNAIKYSYPNTVITVEVHSQADWVEVAVQDQGQGLSPEQQLRLFDEFGHVGNKPTGGESSTGLGLAIVKKIIEAHGGQIGVKSTVGKGSRFFFRLPFLPLEFH